MKISGEISGSSVGAMVAGGSDRNNELQQNLYITKCLNTAKLTGNSGSTGGFVGYTNRISIENCCNKGEVTGGRRLYWIFKL